MSSFRLAQPRAGTAPAARVPRSDIQDKYITSLKEQNRLMELEIRYLKTTASEAKAASPGSKPPGSASSKAPPGLAMRSPAQSESPRALAQSTNHNQLAEAGYPQIPGGSIDAMLDKIRQKAAAEREAMEEEHSVTKRKVEEQDEKLKQLQRYADQLDTDKQAVHSVYLGRIEKAETTLKNTRTENQKLKRQYEKIEAKANGLEVAKQELAATVQQMMSDRGQEGKKIDWLEERLEEERTKVLNLEKDLKHSKRDCRISQEQGANLDLQHGMLTKENQHFKGQLDASRVAEAEMQIQLGHAKSQLKQSEASAVRPRITTRPRITSFPPCRPARGVQRVRCASHSQRPLMQAELDALVTKYHDCANKLRVAESEVKANGAREQALADVRSALPPIASSLSLPVNVALSGARSTWLQG